MNNIKDCKLVYLNYKDISEEDRIEIKRLLSTFRGGCVVTKCFIPPNKIISLK